ncbi:MAG: DNA polymerase III subunit delta [Thermoleophilia bacterium]|nr:DNA polymerase III subunit delta [Thermoleophilia bacterium]MDH4338942.1 DNA polymerase III subunit delta [Thermoleophilia bacterium]MDH5280301.1 DNA polymerase III subunit delta [Thermoleophilia bacterium]
MADAPDKPVYLLTGSDRPKIETALARLRTHFVAEAIDVTSALDTSGESAVALCNAGSLFGDARLVVIEDVDGRRDSDQRRKGGWKAADVEAVSAYLANPAPATVLALVGEDVKKTTALWKACAKAGRILEYAVAKKGLHGWVTEQFRQRGVQADPEASVALVQIVGDDPRALASEVDKLATWAAGEPVGEREVLALAAPSGDEPLYGLTDALCTHDAPSLIGMSEAIFEKGDRSRRDVAARMAGAMTGHVARLSTLKRFAGRGVGSKEAAAELGMHPFRAQKLSEQAEGFSAEELRDAVVRLAELDGALKGQSRLAADLEVQRALVDLIRRPQAARTA